MRILACGAWDTGAGYPRPRSLLAALRGSGIDLAECRVELPHSGRAKQRLAARPWKWPGAALRMIWSRARFHGVLQRAVRAHRPDVVVVPYPGHLVVPWVRSVYSGPIVLDLFLSAYDTTVEDRRCFRRGSFAARILREIDRRACRAADLVLMDTPQHAAHVAQLIDQPAERTGWVPITDPDAPRIASEYRAPDPGGPLEVLFFGTGVPLHGLEHLVHAVQAAPGVHLTLAGGTAQQRDLAQRCLADRLRLLDEFVARDRLARELEQCHLVAGVFSDHAKAQRVVPFKVVHGLAAGRPVLTADTPAVRHFLRPGGDCFVCPPADVGALARELMRLHESPSELARVGTQARAAYDASFSAAAVRAQLFAELGRVGIRIPESAVSRSESLVGAGQ